MKDKPLAFQIWSIIVFFSIIITITVMITTIIMLDYTNSLNMNFFQDGFLWISFRLVLCIIIISIIFAKIMSNKISKPIIMLEKKVRKMSNKEWIHNLEVDRKDEIGKLTYSIVKMHKNLERLDKEEEFFLQSLSHELKTPIMILKNYCQALHDGIYVNGSFDSTIDVIEEEINTLDRRIKKLLYVSSLEYILEKDKSFETINLKSLILNLANRICSTYENLDLVLELENYSTYGIKEKLEIAIENIIENCVRYAESYIKISMKKGIGDFIFIEISNDGNPIPEDILKHLFEKFHKGRDGNFGLGLYISKKIIEHHKGKISAENKKNQVVFKIQIQSS
ncbi:MAG: HAMP domain-containing sensor histidine kinase [Bacillota bacterium]|nr:HAMP domain-containing sensor histidine kinase [Bacillota bacterium]